MYSDCIELQSSGEILALCNRNSSLNLLVASSSSSSSTSSSSSSPPPNFFDLEFQSIDDDNHLNQRLLPPCPKEERALLKVSRQSERLLIACDGIVLALYLPMQTQRSRRNYGKLECMLVRESNEYIADACWSPHNDEYAILLQRDAIYIIKCPSCFSDERIKHQFSTVYEKISLRQTITEPRALSFFPPNSPLWSSMSASVLYDDGSIYVVCPLLVPGSLIPVTDYNQMLEIEKENEKNKLPSTRSVPTQKVNGTTLRLTWLQDFFKVTNNLSEMIFTPISTHELFGSDIDISATNETKAHWSVCLQGPIQSVPHVTQTTSEHQLNSTWSDIIARSAAVILPNTSSVTNFVMFSVVRRDEVKTIMSVAPLTPSWSRCRNLGEDSSVLIAIPGVVMPQEDAREQCLDHFRMVSEEGNPDWVLVDATSLPISLTGRSPFFIRDENLDSISDLFYIANDNSIFEVSQSWRRALIDPGLNNVDYRSNSSRILWERLEEPSNNFLSVCISSDLSGFISVQEVLKTGVKVALRPHILQKRISSGNNNILPEDKHLDQFEAPSVKTIIAPMVTSLSNKVDYLEKLEGMINSVRELRNKQLELHNRAELIKTEGADYKAAYNSLYTTLISLETKQEMLIQNLKSTRDFHQNLLDRVQCVTRLLKCSSSTNGSQIEEDLLSLRKSVFKTRGVLADSADSPVISRNDVYVARQFSSVVGDDIASKAEIELAQVLNTLKTTLESSYRSRINNLRLVTDLETSVLKHPLPLKRKDSLGSNDHQLGRERSPISQGREQSSTLHSRARSRSASRKGRLSLSSHSASQIREDAFLPASLSGADPLRDALEVRRVINDLSEMCLRIKEAAAI